MVRRSMRQVLFVSSLLGGAGVVAALACGPREDYTPPIAVSPGAAQRAGLIPSRRGEGRAGRGAATPRARAHPLVAGQELGGPNATGRPGDWVLENDEVVFVVDHLGGGSGFAESGGNLVDAADARVRADELGQLFTYFGAFPRQAVYVGLDASEGADGSVALSARGTDIHDPSLHVVTEYRLGPSDRALLLRTTLTNRGAARATVAGLGDVVQWGGTEKIAPGKPLGFKGPSRGPYLGGIGRHASYGLTSVDGEIGATSGGAWSDTVQVENVALEPGQSVTYERVLVVGERPDLASVVSELAKASGERVGTLAVSLVDATGRPLRAPAGAKVILSTPAGQDVLSVVAAKDVDAITGEVPPGRYVVSFAPSAGRRAAPGPRGFALEVKPGVVARATVAVSEPSEVSLGPCTELGPAGPPRSVPCKLTLEGLAGTPTPDLGPAHVAGPAKNQVLLTVGERLRLPLPHGRYRVTASRGPESELAVAELAVPGADLPPFALRRVVDTRGYVATDFHQHTILSSDAATTTRDRIVANAAEGVEVAVASEHNVIADLGPVVRDLGLTSFVVEVPGDEVTTDASRAPWGHLNVFPLDVLPVRPRGGALEVRDRPPRAVFADVRALPGARVIQVNHPRSGANGYFDLLGFDPRTGRATSPEFEADFDALEVWCGRNVQARAKVLEDFLALLRSGKRVTPIADTDTHGIVGQEAGYPRTYVRVKDDADLASWDAVRTADLVESVRVGRDVVLTNGPFVQVTANGAGIGGTARAKSGRVEVDVVVRSASFVQVDRAELRLARGGADARGAAVATVERPSAVALVPVRASSGEMVARARFVLRVPADDAFVVIVSGREPMRPVLAGDDADIAPWAMTGAIHVTPR